MAIYHFSAKVISRANGSSVVAAAAYRSASRLQDERLDRPHDFTGKAGVVHSEILQPEGTPERWQDRATLWNEVEAGELRKDAQLAREIEFAIPREMDQAQGIALARDFVEREFTARGMVADLNVHWDVAEDGSPKPHAHVMLSMREAGPTGFGHKLREWNSTELLLQWREGWGEHVNQRLAELGIETRIDHRSFKDQEIALEPQNKIGPSGARRDERGEAAERAEEHRAIARRNGERIIADPSVALAAITRQQSTFTDHDLARFVHRHSDDKQQFDQVLAAVRASPETTPLGRDGQGRERFTSREMLAVERRLESSAEMLGDRRGHGVRASYREAALSASEARGLKLSEQQGDAFWHVTGSQDLSLVVGYAGTGKSAMLGVAKEAWEAQGYQVRGAALSGMAAENLEGGSAIGSRTLASWEHAWARGREQLGPNDVLVIDEAGLIGSRQMERVLSQAQAAGAKVVLVGDAEQLQAIEAGAAFRALTERHGAAELTEIRRQQVDWQQAATRRLATGRTGEALSAYQAAGMVRGHLTADQARAAVVDGWDAVRHAAPEKSQVMLAYTRDDVAALNELARERMRASGSLGTDQAVETTRGERQFADGDRVMFLRNERSLGVKNGSFGEIEDQQGGAMIVRLDEGRRVAVDLKAYNDLDHGYATTIHKSQGVTVDRVQVLASPFMDRHAAYVALSRHREGVALHYDREAFSDAERLTKALSRERAKDTTLDYPQEFAQRRGIGVAPEAERRARADGVFANFRPLAKHDVVETHGQLREMEVLTSNYARALVEAERMRRSGLPVLEHQRQALDSAGRGLERFAPGLSAAVARVTEGRPGLARKAARGESGALLAQAQRLSMHPGRKDHGERQRSREPEVSRPPPTRDRDRGYER